MKDDTVSRVAAIDAVSRGCQEFRGIFAECEKNLNALPAVQTCEDAVSRADVLETYADLYDVFEDSRAICKELHKVYDRINALPAVQPQRKTDEWCTDCREYDKKRHCCPRFNRVIRQTLSEQTEVIRCKDCKHRHLDGMTWNCPFGISGGEDFFCSYGAKDGDSDDE